MPNTFQRKEGKKITLVTNLGICCVIMLVYRFIGRLRRILTLILAVTLAYSFYAAAFNFFHLRGRDVSVVVNSGHKKNHLVNHYTWNGTYEKENNRRIFFHESTGRNELNFRQSCAIESAAKHNPTRPVQVFMLNSTSFDYSSQWLHALSHYDNVEIVLINGKDYFFGTPLETWYNKGDWLNSPYSRIHLSDYLRMLTLFKGGGLYLDIDILTIREIDVNKAANFFAIEDRETRLICNSVFHLDKEHRFVHKIIKYLVDDYDPMQWGYHGGDVITAVMQSFCGFKLGSIPPINDCTDTQLFSHKAFFPIRGEDYDIMLLPTEDASLMLLNGSYGVHIWNSKSHHDFLDMTSNQLYVYLAKLHCPFSAAKASECEW